MLAPGDDYIFDADDIIVEEEVTPPETAGDARPDEIPPSEKPSEQVSVNAEDPVVDGSVEQPSAGLPTIAEDPVLPVQTEKSKKKSSKRKRTEESSGGEVSRSAGRLINYKECGFFEDKLKAADVIYGLKLAEASVEGPLLSELEESEAYARYARNQLKSQALLNKVIIDYQMKLTEAREAQSDTSMVAKMREEIKKMCDAQMLSGEKLIEKSRECRSLRAELKDARQALNEQPNELKTELEELHLSNACLAEELRAKKEEADKLKATLATTTDELASKSEEVVKISVLADKYFSELEENKDSHRRTLAELKALGGYSKDVKARADRLRERLVYLDKVRSSAKKADQARSIVLCLQNLVSRGAKIFPGAIERMERDAAAFEAEFREVEPFELEEGDLTPLGAYVPSSDRFKELLGIEVPAELPEMAAVQDPPAARLDEVEEGA